MADTTTVDLPDLSGLAEHYGVRLTLLGDDGDSAVALGHHSPRRFLAALSRMVRRDLGWHSLRWETDWTLDEAVEGVAQGWAVLALACDDHDSNDPDCRYCADIREAGWWISVVDEGTPGAFPITTREM